MNARVGYNRLGTGTKAAAILATLAMLLTILVPQTSAIASPSNSGNTPAKGGGQHGGNLPADFCDDDDWSEKWEWKDNAFQREGSTDHLDSVTATTFKDDGQDEPTAGSFVARRSVTKVGVKAGTANDGGSTFEPAVLEGTFHNDDVDNNAAISHVVFCGLDDLPPPPTTCIEISDADFKDLISYYYDGHRSGWVELTGGTPLCDPVFVRATSWEFVDPQGDWFPQTLVGFNDVTIQEPGRQAFEAPAYVCGQVDIYFGWDKDSTYTGRARNGELKLPEATLEGPAKPFEPKFLSDYGTGSSSPTWHIDAQPCTVDIDGLNITSECAYLGTDGTFGIVRITNDNDLPVDFTVTMNAWPEASDDPNTHTAPADTKLLIKVPYSLGSSNTTRIEWGGPGTAFAAGQNQTALSKKPCGVFVTPQKDWEGVVGPDVSLTLTYTGPDVPPNWGSPVPIPGTDDTVGSLANGDQVGEGELQFIPLGQTYEVSETSGPWTDLQGLGNFTITADHFEDISLDDLSSLVGAKSRVFTHRVVNELAELDLHFQKIVCDSYDAIRGNRLAGNSASLDQTGGGFEDWQPGYNAPGNAASASNPVTPLSALPNGCEFGDGWKFETAFSQGFSGEIYEVGPTVVDAATDGAYSVSSTELLGEDAYRLLTGQQLWVREVLQEDDGYAFGALQCYGDALHPDNLEFIRIGNTVPDEVWCVAWNVAKPEPEPEPEPELTTDPFCEELGGFTYDITFHEDRFDSIGIIPLVVEFPIGEPSFTYDLQLRLPNDDTTVATIADVDTTGTVGLDEIEELLGTGVTELEVRAIVTVTDGGLIVLAEGQLDGRVGFPPRFETDWQLVTIACDPSIEAVVTAPECDDDFPLLGYTLDTRFIDPDAQVTITFSDGNGNTFVYEDQPLAGAVPWPGALAAGESSFGRTGPQWPGWSQDSAGTWFQDDDYFGWAVPQVLVTFAINPEITVEVSYPQATPDCLTGPAQIGLTKTATSTELLFEELPDDAPDDAVGEFLGIDATFEFVITNTGAVTLYRLALEDDQLDYAALQAALEAELTDLTLDPGESVTVSFDTIVAAGDMTFPEGEEEFLPFHTNVATTTGFTDPEEGGTQVSASDDETILGVEVAGLVLEQDDPPATDDADEQPTVLGVQLARTGTSSLVLMLIGLLSIALGSAAVLVRRRRSEPTG